MDILHRLVDSKSKSRLLAKMLALSDSSLSVSELGRLADLPKASVSAIVAQWQGEGLALARQQGRNKIVSLNSKYYLLPELKKIFEKTKDFQKPLIEELESIPSLKSPKVKAVVVFGSRIKGGYSHSSDLDVLVGLESMGEAITERIVEEFAGATERTGVRFSPILMDEKEIRERLREKDKFILGILNSGKAIKGGKWLGHIQAAS